jgi:hypothetical protein
MRKSGEKYREEFKELQGVRGVQEEEPGARIQESGGA